MHIKHLMHTFSHLHLAVVDKQLHMKLYLHILIGVYIWVVTVVDGVHPPVWDDILCCQVY